MGLSLHKLDRDVCFWLAGIDFVAPVVSDNLSLGLPPRMDDLARIVWDYYSIFRTFCQISERIRVTIDKVRF